MKPNESQTYDENATQETEQSIIITHFKNPHQFWFKYTSQLFYNQSTNQFEADLATYANTFIDRNKRENYFPHVGDIVAAFNVKWNKWIRAKVELIDNKGHGNTTKIHLWAIDHGRPLVSTAKYIIALNDAILVKAPPTTIQYGGLNNIVPAESNFNLDTFSKEFLKIDSWSTKAIQTFSNILADAKDIIFKTELILADRRFGRLKIIRVDGSETCPINEILQKIDEAVLSDDFKNDILLRYGNESLQPVDDAKSTDTINQIVPIQNEMDLVDAISNENESVKETICVNQHANEKKSIEVCDLESNLCQFSLPDDDQFFDEIAENMQSPLHTKQSKISNSIRDRHNVQLMEYEKVSFNTRKSFDTNTTRTSSSKSKMNFSRLLVHTDCSIAPTESLHETFYFCEEMRKYLTTTLSSIRDSQSFGWPHLMRNNSLVLIDAKPSNNMMVYLPALCQLVKNQHTDESTSGPIAIILCASSAIGRTLTKLCKKLLDLSNNNNLSVVLFKGTYALKATVKKLLLGKTDVLISTPFCLMSLLEEMPNNFLTNRLRHVCFDKIDQICNIYPDHHQQIMKLLFTEENDIQISTTSQLWHPILSEICKLVKNPLLLIGFEASFEASFYAESKMYAEFIENDRKCFHLAEKLRQMSGSAVIICNTKNEAIELSEFLKQVIVNHFVCIYEDSGNKTVNEWLLQSTKRNNFAKQNFLVCTDQALREHYIRTAQHIVHYSLPDSLQQFSQRYSSSFGYYSNLLASTKSATVREDILQPTSTVYFDEIFHKDMLAIVGLLNRYKNSEIPAQLNSLAQEMQMLERLSKSNKALCSELITKGIDCDSTCPYRHLLNEEDFLLQQLPETGMVKLELLEVLEPNHFAVRVLERRRNALYKWKQMPNSYNQWIQFNESLITHYSNTRKIYEPHYPIECGDLCAILLEKEPFRCRIVSKKSSDNVKVYLLDAGKTVFCDKSALLRLDQEFIEFPVQTVDLFLIGVEPADLNPDWLSRAAQSVDRWLSSTKFGQTTDYIQAEIIKSLKNTLVVTNLKLVQVLSNTTRSEISVEAELIKHGFAVKSTKAFNEILTKMEATTTTSLSKNILDASILSTITDATPVFVDLNQIATKGDNLKAVNSDCAIGKDTPATCEPTLSISDKSSKLKTKNMKCPNFIANDLAAYGGAFKEKEIELYQSTNTASTVIDDSTNNDKNYTIDNCIVNETICQHKNINGDNEGVMLIDFTNDPPCSPSTPYQFEYKPKSTDFSLLLDIFANDSAADLSRDKNEFKICTVDTLDPIDLQPVEISAYHSPTNIYLRKIDRKSQSRALALYDEVDQCTEREANFKLFNEKPVVGTYCLVKCEDVYQRAQIVDISEGELMNTTVQLFCCDSGLTFVCKLTDLMLISDYLLEIPLQAIHCRLIGTKPLSLDADALERLNDVAYRELLSKYSNLYAKVIADPSDANNNNSSSINVILLHKFDNNRYININQIFVEKKWAVEDEKDKLNALKYFDEQSIEVVGANTIEIETMKRINNTLFNCDFSKFDVWFGDEGRTLFHP